jgi:copper homeostasis protein
MIGSAGRPLVEVAVDSLEAAEMAWSLSADRIELCQALELGGLTPSRGLMEAVVAGARGPVFAMVRPKPGDFVLTASELAVSLRDIATARDAGCTGVVIGPLLVDGSLAAEAIGQMVRAATGLSVTFHRAFDLCPDPLKTLAQLVDLGVTRILSSGGAATAHAGRARLAKLVARGDGHLTVIGGGGVIADHVVELVRNARLKEIHLSGSQFIQSDRGGGYGMNTLPNPARLIRVLDELQRGFGARR